MLHDRTQLSKRSTKFLTALLLAWVWMGLLTTANAQDTATKQETSLSLQDASLEEVLEQYNQATEKLRSSLKKVQAAKIRFHNDSSDESETHRKAWEEAVESGKSDIESLRVATMELFRRQEKPYDLSLIHI